MLEKKEGETSTEYKKRLRNLRNDLNKHIENAIEEQKAKKQKKAIDHQKSLFDLSHDVSGALYDATGCATSDEIEEEKRR